MNDVTTSGTPHSVVPVSVDQLLDEFARRLIRRKARSLVGKFGFTRSDRDDLEQELILDLIERAPRFDPERLSQRAFVASIVRNKLRCLIRARKRIKRRKHAGDDTFDAMCDGAQASYRGIDRAPAIEIWERVADLQTVLDRLPDDLRMICERLKEQSISSLARDLHISRKTLRAKMQAIHAHFEAAGLDKLF